MLAPSGRRLRCLCVIAALILASVVVPSAMAAGGDGNAFNELTENPNEASSTAPTATSPTETNGSTGAASSSSNSNSSSVLLPGLIGAGALIAGIAFLILRDARSVAPVPEGQMTGVARSGRDPAAMMRKRRAKAKAARRQRKRNR